MAEALAASQTTVEAFGGTATSHIGWALLFAGFVLIISIPYAIWCAARYFGQSPHAVSLNGLSGVDDAPLSSFEGNEPARVAAEHAAGISDLQAMINERKKRGQSYTDLESHPILPNTGQNKSRGKTADELRQRNNKIWVKYEHKRNHDMHRYKSNSRKWRKSIRNGTKTPDTLPF